MRRKRWNRLALRTKFGSSPPTGRPICLFDYAATAADRGLEVLIAGAGGAAHLPGMAAAKTTLPVLGVPIESVDPAWRRFAAVNRANAGGHSRRHVGDRPGRRRQRRALGRLDSRHLKYPAIRTAVEEFRSAQTTAVLEHPDPRNRGPVMTIGILGGGQLGRMLILAGCRSGLRFRVLDPARRGGDRRPGAERVVGEYEDYAALADFVGGLDAVTYEFENVPVRRRAWLAERVPVFPPPRGAGRGSGPHGRKGVLQIARHSDAAAFAAVDDRAAFDSR